MTAPPPPDAVAAIAAERGFGALLASLEVYSARAARRTVITGAVLLPLGAALVVIAFAVLGRDHGGTIPLAILGGVIALG